MALYYRTCGFVIKKNDIAEADRIFTIFSRDFGKIRILGKSIRKIPSKLKSGIDIFYLSEIEFIQGKTYKTLTDSVVLEKFKNIRKNLIKLKIIHKIAGSLNGLLGVEEKDDKLWDLVNETFEKLEDYSLPTKNYLSVYYYFLWNFFSILGYKPELFHCAVCQTKLSPNTLYFSPNEGGIVCNLCINKTKNPKKVNSDLVKILKIGRAHV